MAVAPIRPKGPPLNALRAFEAAARLGSFVAAGQELSVTPGAISQHVKTVEAWAGQALFHRNPQGITLTAAGRSLLPDVSSAFDAMAEATQSLRALNPNAEVHIAALPSVAQLWLPARLSRLRAALPGRSISVTALETPPSLTREMFDLSIFFARPDDSPDQIVLANDTIFPVAAPDLSMRGTLADMPLLHDRTWDGDWRLWAQATATPLPDPDSGPRFSLYSLAVEDAKAGGGALMGHDCLIEHALADGTLTRLSDKACPTGKALVLSLPPRAKRRPEIDQIAALLVSDTP